MRDYQFFNPSKDVDIAHSNLPHWRQECTTYFVTFRLADALPKTKLLTLESQRAAWLSVHPEPHSPAERSAYLERFSFRLEAWLDAGEGTCILKDPRCAAIVETALRHFDEQRYRLGPFTIAANHVHAMVSPLGKHTLSSILHSWKSFSANRINRLLGRSCTVWQKESYDHIVRNVQEAYRIEQYIARHER
jgi:REP element-mobilizing transposase RayT